MKKKKKFLSNRHAIHVSRLKANALTSIVEVDEVKFRGSNNLGTISIPNTRQLAAYSSWFNRLRTS